MIRIPNLVSPGTNGKLPFLDLCLCRKADGSITTSVHRKATHANQYLSFDSHHPMAHKASTVRTLMSRASALSSNGVERVAEEKRIVDALKENGYPLSLIHRYSGSRTSRPVKDHQRPPRTSLTLPYIGGLSKTIRRILGPLDSTDPVPMDKRTGGIYQIACSECLKVYVRQSGRTLNRRALQNGDVATHLLVYCSSTIWETHA